jgi:hypothetical protein
VGKKSNNQKVSLCRLRFFLTHKAAFRYLRSFAGK